MLFFFGYRNILYIPYIFITSYWFLINRFIQGNKCHTTVAVVVPARHLFSKCMQPGVWTYVWITVYMCTAFFSSLFQDALSKYLLLIIYLFSAETVTGGGDTEGSWDCVTQRSDRGQLRLCNPGVRQAATWASTSSQRLSWVHHQPCLSSLDSSTDNVASVFPHLDSVISCPRKCPQDLLKSHSKQHSQQSAWAVETVAASKETLETSNLETSKGTLETSKKTLEASKRVVGQSLCAQTIYAPGLYARRLSGKTWNR